MKPSKPWREWADDDLADEAQEGLRGQGALVEALRRHREELVNQQRSTNVLTWVLIVLGILMIVLVGVQIWQAAT
jgi:hypothetical protein